MEFPYDAKLKVLQDQVLRWIREVSAFAHTPHTPHTSHAPHGSQTPHTAHAQYGQKGDMVSSASHLPHPSLPPHTSLPSVPPLPSHTSLTNPTGTGLGSGLGSGASGASLVKRALLGDIGRLCVFFGQEATADLLLTQVLTFLNDQVRLRRMFLM